MDNVSKRLAKGYLAWFLLLSALLQEWVSIKTSSLLAVIAVATVYLNNKSWEE